MSTEFYPHPTPEPAIPPQLLTSLVHSPNLASVKISQKLIEIPQNDGLTCKFSPWCASVWKRVFDVACVAPALVLISPILGIIAITVRLTSPGPVIFRQGRVGQHRKIFTIYKFRTMVENSQITGPSHTAKGDPRITPIGNWLRRFKLDELPQLYNVLRGDMSLVGPRPKLPDHEHTPMTCRPGVTGAATLAFCDEQHILSEVPSERLEAFYKEYVVPIKIQLDMEYMQKATLATDLRMLIATVIRSGKYVTHHDLLLSLTRFIEPMRPHADPAAKTSQILEVDTM